MAVDEHGRGSQLTGGEAVNIVLLLVSLALFAVVAVALLLDRAAQAEAWRRIAEERRWNYDHREVGYRS